MQAARVTHLAPIQGDTKKQRDDLRRQNAAAMTFLANRLGEDWEDGMTETETLGLARIVYLLGTSGLDLAK